MAYDPSEHTVAEVQDYLEENPEEFDEVLAAEKEGKNRQGIVSLDRPEEAEEAEEAPAEDARDFDSERTEARRHNIRDPQLVMAEAAKLLNRGAGQEPFKRQD